jgi:hypothetical protein
MHAVNSKLGLSNESRLSHCHLFRLNASPSERINVEFSDGSALGVLNDHTSKILRPFIMDSMIEFDAIAHIQTLRDTISRARTENDAVSWVDINVYGTKKHQQNTATQFSQNQIYFQYPDQRRSGSLYDNPHCITFPGFEDRTTPFKPDEITNFDTEVANVIPSRFEESISDVYGSLKRSSGLKRVEASDHLETELLP